MAASMTSCVQSITESSLREAGVDETTILSVGQTMSDELAMAEKPVEFLNSVSKQDEFFRTT